MPGVTESIGIANLQAEGDENGPVTQVYAALYPAKENDRNRVEIAKFNGVYFSDLISRQ